MIKKAKTIAPADAGTAVATAISLAKGRVNALAGNEIDEVSGGLKLADTATDPGVTAGLISPDVGY